MVAYSPEGSSVWSWSAGARDSSSGAAEPDLGGGDGRGGKYLRKKYSHYSTRLSRCCAKSLGIKRLMRSKPLRRPLTDAVYLFG